MNKYKVRQNLCNLSNDKIENTLSVQGEDHTPLTKGYN